MTVEVPNQEEKLQQMDTVATIDEKINKTSGEEKDLPKSEQHKEDTQPTEQKEQEQTEQVIAENSKPLVETGAIDKSASKPTTHRASANIPIGKKPSTQKQLVSYTSPPKHVSPKPTANLQSEFQQVGYEIEDGYDSDGDLNTFSELPKEEASTTSLEDSLLGSESFVSLDNYNKDVGSQKPKTPRVGSAKERDRKHSQETEAQRKTSQDALEARLKESKVTMLPRLQSQGEEVMQKATVNLTNETPQASETKHSSIATELSASNVHFDVAQDKETSSLVNSTGEENSDIVIKQKEPLSMAATADDDGSADSDSSDDDIVTKGRVRSVCLSVCLQSFVHSTCTRIFT